MKKLLILIAIVLFSAGVKAQVSADGVLTQSRRFNEVRLHDYDIVTSTNSISKYFTWDIAFGVKYKINVSADSLTTPYSKFILKESTNGVNFLNIDTVVWTGTSTDTAFVFDKTGSVTTNLMQSLTLADSSSVSTLTQSLNDYRYTRYVGVTAIGDSTASRLQLTNLDITIWLEK